MKTKLLLVSWMKGIFLCQKIVRIFKNQFTAFLNLSSF